MLCFSCAGLTHSSLSTATATGKGGENKIILLLYYLQALKRPSPHKCFKMSGDACDFHKNGFQVFARKKKHISCLIFRYINTCLLQESPEGQESDVYQANPVCAGGACAHSWRSAVWCLSEREECCVFCCYFNKHCL